MRFLKTAKQLKKDQKGFTLVEIIVVLVILAILAAITIPAMTGFISQSEEKAYITEARTAYVAAQAYVTEKLAAGDTATAITNSFTNKAITACPDKFQKLMVGSATDGAVVTSITIDNSATGKGKVSKFVYKVKGNTITIEPGKETTVS